MNNRAVHILIHRCGPFVRRPDLGEVTGNSCNIRGENGRSRSGVGSTLPAPYPLVPVTWKEGLTVILPRHPDDGTPSSAGASVTPIGIPPRHELWQRIVLAKAVLGHRTLTVATADLLLRILDGEQIPDLNNPPQGQ